MSETLKGLSKTLKKLKQFEGEIDNKVDSITYANVQEMATYAKQEAPRDLGTLMKSIAVGKEIGTQNEISYKVIANSTGLAPYSAYMEFGTGGLVVVPPELKEIASRFRGKGQRKVDIRPRPFMYPALVRQRRIYLEDLESLLETETNKI